MFEQHINIDDNYFYMPFGPTFLNHTDVGLSRVGLSNKYIDKKRNSKWRKCKLYNTGWGRPDGFERLPELHFNELIQLVLMSSHETTSLSVIEEESNKYGAVAIIMDRYVRELIDFLYQNINNDLLFSNKSYCNNLKLFCFDPLYLKNQGGSGNASYAAILNQYPQWHIIAPEVIARIYGSN